MDNLEDRLGRCYELAAKFVMENPSWSLVHGFITDKFGNSGNTIDHAWAMKDGWRYDAVLDIEFLDNVFDALFFPENLVIYPSIEMTQRIYNSCHWGPWHEIDRSKIIFNKKP